MDVNGIIDRAKEAFNVQQDQELADKLSVSRSTIAAWRRRGSVPAKYLSEMMTEGTISLDWLLTGKGDRLSVNRHGVPTFGDGEPFPIQKEELWVSLLILRRDLLGSDWDEEKLAAERLSDDVLSSMHLMLMTNIRRVSRSRQKWLKSGTIRPDHIFNALVAEYGFGKFENPPPPWWDPASWPDDAGE